ncbi:MAG: LLM class flavin-dependent oxidoreductase, partial [Acidobacteriota bacterium]|nr:LLM class flavin-dependent oxidoreductase [Acidobacteriota bacterium]
MRAGCFVGTGGALERATEHVRLAESLGYEAAYVSHIAGRESLTVLTAFALATERIRLGTAVVPIYSRTPATMAQTAATIDDISHGRLNLGLGVSHRVVVENWHGQSIDRPAAEMREYVAIVRAILRGESPPAGEKWHTSFHLMGLAPRPELPVYIAALSPAMLRLAGEIGQGVLLWLCVPEYIEQVVVPEVRRGRERAGLPLEGFEIVPAVPCALTDDRTGVHEGLRGELLTYFSLPFYRAMIERSGFSEEIASFDGAGGDPEAMKAAISERFLDALSGIGDEAAV